MVKLETPEWECVLDAQATLAETPIYAPEDDALFFSDIGGRTLNRLDLATGVRRAWPTPDGISSYALTPDRRHALVAAHTKLVWLNLETGALADAAAADVDPAHYQLNDGHCDRTGRFWVGSYRHHHSPEPEGQAKWYRFDERGFSPQFSGVTIANGSGWSPDGRTMYVSDRTYWRILAFDYDPATGEASNRRVFATLDEGEVPDGAAIDTEGGYWVCVYRSGLIRRFRPDGTLDRLIKAPTTHPTVMAFGGPDLDMSYVTTGRVQADTTAEPLAGGIFRARLGARGLPEPRFTRVAPPAG